jgi:hypothetical protein
VPEIDMGFKNRILRRAPADAPGPDTVDAAAADVVSDGGANGDTAIWHSSGDGGPATEEAVAEDLVSDQGDGPADGDSTATAAAPPAHPGFRERGRLRRRLRFLREARELGFRDLGGLVFDQHRFQRPDAALVQGKVAAVDGVDRELRLIEDVLGARRPYEELFVAGVSACPRCGALHGTDSHFCSHCGLDFRGPRAVAGMWNEPGQPAPGAPPGQSALFDPQASGDPHTPPA